MRTQVRAFGGGALAFSALVIFATQYVKSEAVAAPMQRQVEFRIQNKYEPVVITKITLGNVIVQPGRFVKPVGEAPDPVTPFTAGDDWVQNLTVYLLNRTNQVIVYAHLVLSFPETSDRQTRFRAMHVLTLGRIPESAAFDAGRPIQQLPGLQAIRFPPRQVMAIRLGDYIDQIKKDVEPYRALAAMTDLDVTISTFFFADGLRWTGGFQALDRQSLTWHRMGLDYFPGDPDGNWPGRPGWVDQDRPNEEERQ